VNRFALSLIGDFFVKDKREKMKNSFKHKLLQLFILIGIIASSAGIACSSFVLKNGDKFVFGYNHDFAPDVNFYIMTNTRDIKKTAFVENDKPAKWTSKYGSITFNMGKEFPMAGMNEKGLVVALHSLDNGGKLPNKDKRATVGNGASWVQYQLDNSASIEDIIASDKIIRCSLGKASLYKYII
jgi:penicillin V acylase-like amidase (Ntn superfamily)